MAMAGKINNPSTTTSPPLMVQSETFKNTVYVPEWHVVGWHFFLAMAWILDKITNAKYKEGLEVVKINIPLIHIAHLIGVLL